MVRFQQIRTLALALPGVEEGTSYGTPAFKVRGKLIARLKEDQDTLVVRVDWQERERRLAAEPEVYSLTEHYRGHPWVLLTLSAASEGQAKAALRHAWEQAAPAPGPLRSQ